MATSKVTVHFPSPVEQVWDTVTDLLKRQQQLYPDDLRKKLLK